MIDRSSFNGRHLPYWPPEPKGRKGSKGANPGQTGPRRAQIDPRLSLLSGLPAGGVPHGQFGTPQDGVQKGLLRPPF